MCAMWSVKAGEQTGQIKDVLVKIGRTKFLEGYKNALALVSFPFSLLSGA